MNNKNTELLGKMDVKKALITLSIPAIIGMLVNAMYNLVDSLFVGWGAGEVAIGALTLAFPVQLIVMAVALMIGIGGASVFSRAYGAGDKTKMDATVNTAIRFGAMAGLLISVLGLVFLTPLLQFFGASSTNIGFAQDYLSVILFGSVFQTISMILNNFTRAEGRAKVAMIAMVIGTGLNIVLDPIFIFDWGLGLGVKGAAIATVISQVTAFIFITYKAFDKESVLAITLKKFFKIDFESLKEIVVIGFPTFVRNSLGAILAIIILKLIVQFTGSETESDMYTSIYGVINRVLMFIFMPGFGLVQGLAPIAGYNFGAKKWERLIELVKYTTKLLSIYFIVGFLLLQIFAFGIFDVFSSANNEFFISEGGRIFRIVGLALPLITYQIIAGSIYQAFGYPKRALFISLSRQFLFFIPLAFLLTNIFGLNGLWYTFFIADFLSGLIGIFMLVYEVRVLGRRALEQPSIEAI